MDLLCWSPIAFRYTLYLIWQLNLLPTKVSLHQITLCRSSIAFRYTVCLRKRLNLLLAKASWHQIVLTAKIPLQSKYSICSRLHCVNNNNALAKSMLIRRSFETLFTPATSGQAADPHSCIQHHCSPQDWFCSDSRTSPCLLPLAVALAGALGKMQSAEDLVNDLDSTRSMHVAMMAQHQLSSPHSDLVSDALEWCFAIHSV